MLVETPDDRGDDEAPAREPWLVTLLDWFFPWPAVIVWLCVASGFTDGWAGAIMAYAAVMLAVWRGLRAMPVDGLNKYRL